MTGKSPTNSAANHWERVSLADVCQIVARQVDPKQPEFACLPHVNGENIESGTRRLHGVRSAAEDGMTSGKYLFEPGDVLYSKLRPYLRKVVLVDFRGLCSADAYPIRVNPNRLDADYLAWALLSDDFTEYADAESRRARMPKLNREQLFAWNIPLPPLAEQRRIAGRLREQLAEVAKARTAVQAQLASAQALPAAALRDVFNSPNAESWPRRCLGDVCELLPSKSICLTADAEVRAITTASLTETGFDPAGIKTGRMWASDVPDCTVRAGEILIARSNTPELVGRVALFNGESPVAVASDLTIRIWPGADRTTDVFVIATSNDASKLPTDESWTGAEIRSCCRLAALLDLPLTEAARNIVPVAVTASESVDRLRTSRRNSPAERLQASTAAVRLSLRWFGVRKTLSPEQKAEAAEAFGAAGEFLSAGKKLLDTRHPAYGAVSSVRGRIQSVWKGLSLPYPEPAIRLIRRVDIERLYTQLTSLRGELTNAVEQLDRRYAELRTAAQQRLGRLFNLSDYPASLSGLFAVEWDFPSIEPPDYLRQLNPELYEQKCRRVSARFDEALQLAEQAFLAELSQLVTHLTDRLSGTEDGKPKVFRDTVVSKLSKFFERFRRMNVRSNEQLDNLVSQVEDLVNGVQPQSLHENRVLRESIAAELNQLQPVFDGLLVDRPRRNLLRQAGTTPVQEAA